MACYFWNARLLLAALLLAASPLRAEEAMAFRGSLATSIEQAPADISAATLSVVAMLRGLRDTAALLPVTFEPGVAEKLHDPHTRFEGFDLKGFRLTYLGPSASGHAGRRIIGVLIFEDASGRRAEMSYALDYRLQGEKLIIDTAGIDRATPLQPRVMMYAVPVNRVPTDFLQKLRPFGEMRNWLAENAAPVGELPLKKEPHYIFALSLDRLGGGDRLILDRGEGVAQSLLDIGGWQIVVRRLPATGGNVTVRTDYRSGKTGRIAPDIARLTLQRQ